MWKRNSRVPLDRYEAQRICLIKPSALGDVVQTLPVLGALRRRFPEARLSWVVNRAYAELIEAHPDLDDVIPFDRHARGRQWWSVLGRLARRLHQGRFDLVCDLQGLLRSGLMVQATRAARRVGLSTAREGAAWFYTDVVPVSTLDMTAVDRYWLVVSALGAGGAPKEFNVALSQRDCQWAHEQLSPLPRPVLVVHPGARWATKRWPPRQFADLAKRAQVECGASIVVVAGPDDVKVAEQIVAALPAPALSLAGRTGLKQLAAVLAQADAVVSGDSGPMHLAAAMGTPVVGLFTCTSPARAAPFGTGHAVVATQVHCAASYLKKCDRLDCMGELSVQRVWPAVAARLCSSPSRERERAGRGIV